MIKDYSSADFLRTHVAKGARVLNAGSAGVRFKEYDCINVDIEKKHKPDILADIQNMPMILKNSFDAVVCVAALQYCEQPRWALSEFYRVLKLRGLLFVKVPFVQPYCSDTPDLRRWTQDGILIDVKSFFDVVTYGPCVRPGSALVMQIVHMASKATENQIWNNILAVSLNKLLTPVKYIRTAAPNQTAGAFYVVAQRRLT